jgi:hypothetical protein
MIVCTYSDEPDAQSYPAPTVREYFHKDCFCLQCEVKEQNDQHCGTAVYEAHHVFTYITEFERIPQCLRCGEALVLPAHPNRKLHVHPHNLVCGVTT